MRRSPVGAWRRIPPGPVRAAYEDVHARLRDHGLPRRTVEGCMNNLFRFLCLADPGGGADPRCLSGAREDMERARAAWAALQPSGVAPWNARHRLRVRTQLARALACVAPALPYAVNPAMRNAGGGGATAVVFAATKSFDRTFDLHGCLPVRVRRLSPLHVEYVLLHRVTDELSNHLRSVSRAHLQRVAHFLDALLHGRPSALGPFWDHGGTPPVADPSELWRWLRRRTPREWVDRFAAVMRHRAAGPVTFEHFKRHVRYVQLLHGRVFGSGAGLAIPVPSCGGRVYCREALEGLSTASSGSGFTSSEGDDGAAGHEERRLLRERMSALREELCRPANGPGDDEAQGVFAFDPDEVRAVVEAAVTAAERLVVVLFLTTGLRIGGLSRLQVPPGLRATRPDVMPARDVPACLTTVEKGGKVRKVRITDACRVLVARWYRAGRPAGESRFLFPGGGGGGAPLTTRQLWNVCRGVFRRARVAGRHVHPHTFRHTVIQMLYMKGMPFDAIAKWIGHASPALTSGIYGRLSQDNLNGLLRGVPFVDEGQNADVRERWAATARFVTRPYVFDERETAGLSGAGSVATGGSSQVPDRTPREDAAMGAGAGALRDVIHRLVAAEISRTLEGVGAGKPGGGGEK